MTETTFPRRLVLAGARRLGVEPELHRAHEALLAAKAGPAARRNAREDARVRLLAAGVLRADSNCVDVGANEGALLSVFTEVAHRGRHIAYEPVPALAERLERAFPGVDVRRAALSDQRGEAEFVVHRTLASRSSLRPVGYGSDETETIRVPLEDLDSALPSGHAVDLLKIDVEGAEHLVLRGALETLRRDRPLVLFEHQRSTASHYGTGPDEIYDLLVEDVGLRVFDMDGAGPYSRDGLRETYERGRRWNFLAC
jgi:FkbM family methyltransferase